MIEYKQYEKPEGGKFLKLKEFIPNEGDAVRLKCKDGEIKDGKFGVKVLEVNVLWHNPETGKNEEKVLTCDAPDENNENNGLAGSQVYRGFCDNNIQDGDVFEIVNGGKMNNKFRTTIYNVQKDVTQPAPQEEEVDVDTIKDMF